MKAKAIFEKLGETEVQVLDDGILAVASPQVDYLVYMVPRRAVKKPYGLRELKNDRQYGYEVPKNHVIARTVSKLADGGSITVMRLLPATITEQANLYNGYTAKGLKVKPCLSLN